MLYLCNKITTCPARTLFFTQSNVYLRLQQTTEFDWHHHHLFQPLPDNLLGCRRFQCCLLQIQFLVIFQERVNHHGSQPQQQEQRAKTSCFLAQGCVPSISTLQSWPARNSRRSNCTSKARNSFSTDNTRISKSYRQRREDVACMYIYIYT